MRPVRYVLSTLVLAALSGAALPLHAFDASIDNVQRQALAGSAEAQVAWGKHLLDTGKPADRAGSTEWFRKAAEQNDREGQWMLGSAYMSGIGVPNDRKLAFEWMRKSLDGGTPDHMATYGLTLIITGGIDGLPNEGLDWLHRGIAAGSHAGMLGLGMLQISGAMGVDKDPAAGEQSIRKAAESGYPDAQAALGSLYLSDVFGPPKVTEAVHWLEAAAAQGRADAQGTLGYMLISGERGVPKDPARGVMWAEKAVAQQAAGGYYALGTAYLTGSGKAKDPAQAWYHFAVASRLDAKHQLTKAADRMSDAATQLKPGELEQLRVRVEKVPLPANMG